MRSGTNDGTQPVIDSWEKFHCNTPVEVSPWSCSTPGATLHTWSGTCCRSVDYRWKHLLHCPEQYPPWLCPMPKALGKTDGTTDGKSSCRETLFWSCLYICGSRRLWPLDGRTVVARPTRGGLAHTKRWVHVAVHDVHWGHDHLGNDQCSEMILSDLGACQEIQSDNETRMRAMGVSSPTLFTVWGRAIGYPWFHVLRHETNTTVTRRVMLATSLVEVGSIINVRPQGLMIRQYQMLSLLVDRHIFSPCVSKTFKRPIIEPTVCCLLNQNCLCLLFKVYFIVWLSLYVIYHRRVYVGT